jgi:hypothetical protein
MPLVTMDQSNTYTFVSAVEGMKGILTKFLAAKAN